jgi:hypothetical protein
MSFPAAVRAFALAVVAWVCGSASAVPVNALPAAEQALLLQDNWPAARWVEPTTFVIAGLSGLDEQPLLEDPSPVQLEPADRAARLLALWIRLAAAADRAEQGSLLEADVPPSLAEDTSYRPGRPHAQPTMSGNVRAIVPAAGGAMTWDIDRASLAVAALPGRASFNAYVSAHPGAQSHETSMDGLPPVRRFQPLPWIGLAVALLAIGWIGWRTAD